MACLFRACSPPPTLRDPSKAREVREDALAPKSGLYVQILKSSLDPAEPLDTLVCSPLNYLSYLPKVVIPHPWKPFNKTHSTQFINVDCFLIPKQRAAYVISQPARVCKEVRCTVISSYYLSYQRRIKHPSMTKTKHKPALD
ncbi:hypothetical protein PV10_04965 [Exophiala mesophila]|uniref:Uncharacterized protein n=1 Tax=Exophiala mesophila TaxID=212818 RepID=A0A0D1ZGG7_EXOME|nr:uncharacterized protein PV10_04965 [Exophiala mesophila]KIV93777.1 hypothetical protein PV10_04965 [Exophiala mesophila]